jgi:hypothetical protein
MHLGFHHPHIAANLLGGGYRFFRCITGDASRDWQSVFTEQGFPLVFVQIHNIPSQFQRPKTPTTVGTSKRHLKGASVRY